MTVCIAALADLGKALVLSCDSALSTEDFSGDQIAEKMRPLSDTFQWWVMFAGNDITQIPSLFDAMLHSLFRITSEDLNTAEIVQRCVLEAYHAIRLRYAADIVLSPIGFTMERFLAESDKHPDLKEKLAAVELGCEALVAGFDFAGDGFIFTVEHPGRTRNHDMAGWAAVGNGAYSAISALLFHSVAQDMELARVLYHVCEAKFTSETAGGVGRHTHVRIAHGGQKMNAVELSAEFIDGIRDAWDHDGKPRIPHGLIEDLDIQLQKYPGLTK